MAVDTTKRRKRGKKRSHPLLEDASNKEIRYFAKLPSRHQKKLNRRLKKCSKLSSSNVPTRFRILASQLPRRVKNDLLMSFRYGMSNAKDARRAEFMLSMPLGSPAPSLVSTSFDTCLSEAMNTLNRTIYGQQAAKNAILRHLGRLLLNPSAPCKPLALCGPPGVGKTRIAKDGIAAAMNRPFSMLALGGASDAHILCGHSFTYEGSTPGFIASSFATHQTRDIVVLLDEVDKVGDRHSSELQSALIHITDPVQNDTFVDDYLGSDVPLDLSSVLWILSLNDAGRLSPVLADRVELITLDGYKREEQKAICKDFMIPRIWEGQLKQKRPVFIDDDCLDALLKHANADQICGMRSAESLLSNVLTEVAIARTIMQHDTSNSTFCNSNVVASANHDRLTFEMLKLPAATVHEGIPPLQMYS